MKLNGKRDDFAREDLYSLEKLSPLFDKRTIDRTIEETAEHVSRWNELATEHGVPASLLKTVGENLRLSI
jgi:serine/threonine-protein kinase HipA